MHFEVNNFASFLLNNITHQTCRNKFFRRLSSGEFGGKFEAADNQNDGKMASHIMVERVGIYELNALGSHLIV